MDFERICTRPVAIRPYQLCGRKAQIADKKLNKNILQL